jgi:ABC-type Mn2+/Zn2+ transport system ATPase subunit
VGTLSGANAHAPCWRVLAGQPRWILADEPLAALDLAHQQALMAHFRRLADQGVGVAVVVHDLSLAMNHADHVIVLERGTVAASGAHVALSPRCCIRSGGQCPLVRGRAGAGAGDRLNAPGTGRGLQLLSGGGALPT